MNITIIGLGVIGGSLGLAIKQNHPRISVTGYDRPGTIVKALRKGAIDLGALTIPSAVHDADIVFLCTPVSSIIDLLPSVASNVKKNAIITDVGSTKTDIVSAARRHFIKNGVFIGGHPMAGSEGRGIDHADALMFQNATYVLCLEKKQRKFIAPLSSLLHSIGARVLFLSAKEHDAVAAAISHLPQLIAVAMMNMIGGKNKKNPAYFQLAAGGFRDITRIASSPYGMWKDILTENATHIQRILKEMARTLDRYSKNLQSEQSRRKFSKRFTDAKSLRDAIPKNSKGFLHPLHDVYVTVDDKPGVLSRLTAALYKAKINIKDIELLKIRDGRGGTFRLSFDSKLAAGSARKVLKKKGIKVL
jgi:prephenate dehydrogenase